MNRKLTCIICPRGCELMAEINGADVIISGNACPKGAAYGTDECTHPTRTVTSTVRVANRPDTMVSVKTADPVPKESMSEVIEKIHGITVCAPIKIGDIILKDLFGTEVIATKAVL